MIRLALIAALAAVAALPADAQEREPVESFVTGQYHHGLPPERAALYGPDDVPALLALLEDNRHARSWAQVVDLLGTIGDDDATASLARFVESRFDGPVRPETFMALSIAPTAVGRIAAKGGRQAEAWLDRSLTPGDWRSRDLRWSTPLLGHDERADLMSKVAISGYARIGLRRTLTRLRAVEVELADDPSRTALGPALREAIAVNELIVERGEPVLRQPDFNRLLRKRMERPLQ